MSWKMGEQCESIIIGAEGESIDAVLLTLRMFMQNNDRISIQKIAKIYAEEEELSGYKSQFDTLRDAINGYLNQFNGVVFFGSKYTNKEILDLVLYGLKGHSNRAKEIEIRGLSESPIIYNMFMNQFNVAVSKFIVGIVELAKINKKALSDLVSLRDH